MIYCLYTNSIPHAVIPLFGRFKSETGGYFLLSVVENKQTGSYRLVMKGFRSWLQMRVKHLETNQIN